MKTITLKRGFTVLVDDEDYAHVSQFNWFPLANTRGQVYAYRNASKNKSKRIYRPQSPIKFLHHMILSPSPGYQTDHINGNTLDNRRKNLRQVTPRQNSLNKGPAHNRTMKGVSQIKTTKRWRAYITPNRTQRHLGVFRTALEAMRAYDKAALEIFGEFARTNLPRETYCVDPPQAASEHHMRK